MAQHTTTTLERPWQPTINLGLPRSGTQSFTDACRLLGMPAWHALVNVSDASQLGIYAGQQLQSFAFAFGRSQADNPILTREMNWSDLCSTAHSACSSSAAGRA